MPARNVVKTYVSGGVYHIYNRGVEKRTIFEDTYDYRVFEHYLKEALLCPSELTVEVKGLSFQAVRRPVRNYNGTIDLLAYCLMPNHFHLLIQQKSDRVIDSFMRSLSTRYSMYFNNKYHHVGSLFQGSYRASLVDSDIYLLHVSRYIHRNPLGLTDNLSDWYSSYGQYIGVTNSRWVKPEFVLAHFSPTELPFLQHVNTYRSFVEYNERAEEALPSEVTLDDDQ